MNNIGTWQGFVLYTMYIIGSIVTIGGTSEAGRDAYIAFFMGGIASLLLYKIYWKIAIKPKKNSKLRKITMGILGCFALHIGAISQSIFTLFLSHMTLNATPDLVIGGFIAITLLAMCKKGITPLARTCEMLFPFVIVLITFSLAAAIPQGELQNLLPIMSNGVTPIIDGVFTSFFFPFAEGFFGIYIIFQSERENQAKKSIFFATIFCILLLTTVFVKNLAVVGYPFISSLYFPSYSVASLITLSNFFQRLEVFVSVVFMLCALVKLCLLLLFAQQAFEEAFEKKISVTILVFIMFNLAEILFKGVSDGFKWLRIYRYYLILPCIILPLILYFINKKQGKKDEKTPMAN